MRRGLLLLAAAAVAAGVVSPQATAASLVPLERALYNDGPTGRFLLDGTWLLRRDPSDVGVRQHWERRRGSAGWAPVTVPNAWNAGDTSMASYVGEPVWYRKAFRLPSSAAGLTWKLRFESVNYRATVWLNGHLIGAHAGPYLPFELVLSGLSHRGTNELVVRVDNRRLPTDFPPSIYTSEDQPGGGWWNWGGIVREVYLRRIDRLDFQRVYVRPRLGCPGCAARVDFGVTLRNYSRAPERTRLAGTFGLLAVRFRATTIPPGGTRLLKARVSVPAPHLWWPADPFLYTVRLAAQAAAPHRGFSPAARYNLATGIRTVSVSPDGRLYLNGAPVSLRGVAVHEDFPGHGAALTPDDRAQLVAQIKDLGATLVRSHYPLHPAFQELADREGLLIWSEVPVYRMVTGFLSQPAVRHAAVDEVRQDILANEIHPSVIVWSVGNELNPGMPPGVRKYISDAARVAHGLDPSRPVGIATEGLPNFACLSGYGPLDVIGVNDYFGWYAGQTANIGDLSGYLDKFRACHPSKAVLVTEFGAEANRDGSPDEKGTYEFQQNFVRYHLGVFATKPWLSGAVYFALREFECRPGWAGGNPLPQPPLHQKGLVAYNGTPKPAYADVQQIYRATQQVGLAR